MLQLLLTFAWASSSPVLKMSCTLFNNDFHHTRLQWLLFADLQT